MRFLDVRNLVGAHAIIANDHQQGADDERHGKHARLLDTAQLRYHNGQDREHHAPCTRADGVANVIARCFMGSKFFFLVERPFRNNAQKTVAPIVNRPFDRIHLAGFAGFTIGPLPTSAVAARFAEGIGKRNRRVPFARLLRSGACALPEGLTALRILRVSSLHADRS